MPDVSLLPTTPVPPHHRPVVSAPCSSGRGQRRQLQPGVAARVLGVLRHGGDRGQRAAHPAVRVSRQHQRRPPRLPQKVAHGGERPSRGLRGGGEGGEHAGFGECEM